MKRFFPLFLPILCLALLVACERAPRLSPLPEGAVILAFGDSLTYGTGAEGGEGYPAVLERLVGRKVINAGMENESTTQGVERLPRVLAEVQPHLVILCHGGDDMIRRVDRDLLEANLMTMVETASGSGAQVLLIAVPPPAGFLQPAPLYARIARAANVPVEVNALSNIVSREEMRSEGIYPNAKGYAALAEEISELVKTNQR